MRHFHALLLLASSVLGTGAIAAPATAIPPILTGAPSAAAINKRCDYFVGQSTRMRKALEHSKAPATVDGTLRDYDQLSELIGDAYSEAGFYRQVSPSAASREAGPPE